MIASCCRKSLGNQQKNKGWWLNFQVLVFFLKKVFFPSAYESPHGITNMAGFCAAGEFKNKNELF